MPEPTRFEAPPHRPAADAPLAGVRPRAVRRRMIHGSARRPGLRPAGRVGSPLGYLVRDGKAAVMPEEEPADAAEGHGLRLSRSDPVAQALVEAIHAGDVRSLTVLLQEHPGLA